jgi:hypothetical protein
MRVGCIVTAFDRLFVDALFHAFSHWRKALQISGMLSMQFCIPKLYVAVPQPQVSVFAAMSRKTKGELLRCNGKSPQGSIEKPLIGTRIYVLVYH